MSDERPLEPEDGAAAPADLSPEARGAEGGAPAGNGADRSEAAFEQQGRSRRESKRIDSLLRQRAEDRQIIARVTAERDAAIRAAQTATATTIDGQIEAARAAKRQAFSDGDADGDLQATEQLAALTARREHLARQPAPAPVQQRPEVSAETEEWIERNPRFRTDAQFQAATLKAHNAALQLDLPADSPDYFRFVEEQLERRFPGAVNRGEDRQGAEDEVQAQATSEQLPERPAMRGPAPVSRSSSGRPASGATTKLPPANMLARASDGARAAGMPIEAYWASVQAMAKSGKINLDTFKAS